MDTSKNTLILIAGPTAVGKTSLAISIAKALNTEIISADSRQFYREMNIGTAKATAEELAEVKHHFIDTLNCEEKYSAGQFEREALALISELFKKHRQLVICGGSGLYIDALLYGIDESVRGDEKIRQTRNDQWKREGLESLKKDLFALDPEAIEHIDANNPHRVIRALEIIQLSGKSYADSFQKKKRNFDFELKGIVLEMERGALYERINQRVDQMMAKGLLEEARSLYPKRDLQALQTVGYQELFAYFDGAMSLDKAVEKIKQHTRNYAKRQITWWKRYPEFVAFDANDTAAIFRYLNISASE